MHRLYISNEMLLASSRIQTFTHTHTHTSVRSGVSDQIWEIFLKVLSHIRNMPVTERVLAFARALRTQNVCSNNEITNAREIVQAYHNINHTNFHFTFFFRRKKYNTLWYERI